MDDKDDEQVLRRRMKEVRIEDAKREFGKTADKSLEQLKQPKKAGLSRVGIFAIALTIVVLAVALILAVLPPQLK